MANGDIGLNKQFLLMSHCFIIYSKIVLSFTQIFQNFASMLSNSSIEDLFFVGKGNTFTAENLILISAFQSICRSCTLLFIDCLAIYLSYSEFSVNNSVKLIEANGKKNQDERFVLLPQ